MGLTPELVQQGGLLIALIAVIKILELAFTKRQSRADGPTPPDGNPPPAWWERVGRIEARLEYQAGELTDLKFALARLEGRLDHHQERM